MANTIPPITDPLGKYWDQPKTSDILLDDTHCLMSKSDFDKLKEYSGSLPSGTYAGKMWKAKKGNNWYLVWYVPHADPNKMGIQYREILLLS